MRDPEVGVWGVCLLTMFDEDETIVTTLEVSQWDSELKDDKVEESGL
jgi:hypothetical protein